MSDLASALALALDPRQREAVDLILEAPFGVVTGLPGSGKTTTLRAALDALDALPPPVDLFGEELPRYLLAAPTGKAAKRMTEATGREASTIHRLLEFGPLPEGGLGFRRNAQNPIEAALVVVDEASMIDVLLLEALSRAVVPGRTRLVLVGDAHQLPSVGPGRVLADLIAAGVRSVRLETLHRAAAESWVCRNAPTILAGRVPELARTHDFQWVECPDAASAGSTIVSLATTGSFGSVPQVLAPQRTGAAGVVSLNRAIQARTNPLRAGSPAVEIEAGTSIHAGDRVIQGSNNYQLGVFNGEVGEVVQVTKDAVVVDFEGRKVSYNAMDARALSLAYALTVHKSQGSEWPWVIVLCHSTHFRMLSRPLLYTAVTRAKKGVVLVGDKAGLERALGNTDDAKRNTTLVERLQGGIA